MASRVEGVEKVIANLQKMSRVVLLATEEGVAEMGERLIDLALTEEPTVPAETFSLRGSGSWFVNGKLRGTSEGKVSSTHPKYNPTPATGADVIAEGGQVAGIRVGMVTGVVVFNKSYAAIVHERGNVRFTTPGSGSKYLESKAISHQGELMQIVGTKVAAVLK